MFVGSLPGGAIPIARHGFGQGNKPHAFDVHTTKLRSEHGDAESGGHKIKYGNGLAADMFDLRLETGLLAEDDEPGVKKRSPGGIGQKKPFLRQGAKRQVLTFASGDEGVALRQHGHEPFLAHIHLTQAVAPFGRQAKPDEGQVDATCLQGLHLPGGVEFGQPQLNVGKPPPVGMQNAG